jgi:hypothetical protein
MLLWCHYQVVGSCDDLKQVPCQNSDAALLAHARWRADFAAARAGSYLDITLEEAAAAVNSWVDQIAEPCSSNVVAS